MVMYHIEEKLYLSAVLMKVGNCECRQIEILGQKDQPFPLLNIVETNAPKSFRIILLGIETND